MIPSHGAASKGIRLGLEQQSQHRGPGSSKPALPGYLAWCVSWANESRAALSLLHSPTFLEHRGLWGQGQQWQSVPALWDTGWALFLTQFSADAIINENYKYLKGFLEDLAPPERSALIQDWELAGLVYLDYIRVNEMLDRIQQVGQCLPGPWQLTRAALNEALTGC